MQNNNNDNPAFILGMFETGLAVGRSLGRNNIKVYGFDYKKDIGFYSRYIKASICPHPISREKEFINGLVELAKRSAVKPVVFITTDDFMESFSRNRDVLKEYFQFNIPSYQLIENIRNKYSQYQLAEAKVIPQPKTFEVNDESELNKIAAESEFPVIIKAKDVTIWRKRISGSVKVFIVKNGNDLKKRAELLLTSEVPFIVQEIIPGPDTNHFKVCVYYTKDGKQLLNFTLMKLRQNPLRFGVGSLVKSIDYPELANLGTKLFDSLNYTGVGSAEFKLDERDGKLKLIEINPRYWQQNSLSEKCGMNFSLINYLDVTGQNPVPIKEFTKGIKWLNIYMDFASFLDYRRNHELSFRNWLKTIKGKKIFSDYAKDDILPGLYEIKFGLKLFNLPKYLYKRLKNSK